MLMSILISFEAFEWNVNFWNQPVLPYSLSKYVALFYDDAFYTCIFLLTEPLLTQIYTG